MPSPFPGMDPYLEEPSGWGGFHSRFINSVSDTIADAVSPNFLVNIEEIEPIYDLEIRDRFIEIRDTHSREVVTTIEVLSPFNKAAGTEGRQAFLRKRRTVMASKTHWIEIDLLRAGERPEEVAGKSDYYALLKRGDAPPPYEAWLFDLRDPLPTIAVPLRSPFEDVPLNLKSILDTVYARGHYADALEYSGKPPLPRLRPADAAWATGQLAATSPLSPE